MVKQLENSTVLIVGLGQIGGSLGYALVGRRMAHRVVGFDIDAAVSRKAVELGVIDEATANLPQDLGTVNMVILAVPIRQIINYLPRLDNYLADRPETIVIDVAGTKAEIAEEVKSLSFADRYFSCHPMAGSEGVGLSAASPRLFDGRTFVMVPPRNAAERHTETVSSVIRSIGAKLLLLDADEHDRLVARSSHLPHLMAIALLGTIAAEAEHGHFKEMVAGSFTSATRVGNCSPDLVLDMILTNREQVKIALEDYSHQLAEVKQLLDGNDESRLRSLIERAQSAAQRLQNGSRPQ